MGVKGLWRLLLPIGRRINIETLEGQILAIDASIWITQFIKAMRDQESGAVRPAAHLIGFFRRICRLRYHGIRPVFVFDGATPEIKRRELALRRKRRDQFVATHGTAAVQRLAKRLLVEQLKKQSKGKGGGGTRTMVGGDQKVKITQSGNIAAGGGAFAAGFNLPESQQEKNETDENDKATGDTKDENKKEDSTDARYEIKDGEVMIFTGGGTASQENNANAGPPQAAAIGDDVNDWDKAVIEIDTEEYENDENNSDNEEVEYDDDLWTSQKSKRQKKKDQKLSQRLGSKNSSSEFFDAEFVLSLDPVDRKEAIELAKKKQRLKSRGEFMPVASNAMEYSQAQVRNFLRSTQLNKDIVIMAKQAVKVDSHKNNGERVASDHTQRVYFEKDDNGKGNDDSSSYDSEEDDKDSDDGGFLRTDKRPTHARRLASKQHGLNASEEVQRRHRLRKMGGSPGKLTSINSNVNSDDDEGLGFFTKTGVAPEKSPATTAFTQSAKRRPVVDDADSSDESHGGGGFMSATGNTKTTSTPAAASSTAAMENLEDTEASEGGGFMTSVKASKSSPSGGVGFVHSNKKGAYLAKKTGTSSHADRREQFQEDDDISDAGDSVDKGSNNKTVKRPKSFKAISYSAGAAKAAVGALFRSSPDAGSDDDESSQDGGGFLRGKPVINGGRLKSTGLEDEVIIIDGDGDRPLSVGALKGQELQDEIIARALQEEEDAHIAANYATAGLTETQAVKSAHADGIVGSNHMPKEKGTSLGTIEGQETRHANSEQPSESIQFKDKEIATGLLLAGDDGSEDEEEGIDWENGDSSGDEMKQAEMASPPEKESSVVMAMDTKKCKTLKTDVMTDAVAVNASHSNREHMSEPRLSAEHSDEESDNIDWQDEDSPKRQFDKKEGADLRGVKGKEKQLPASSPTRQTMSEDEAFEEEPAMDVDQGINDFGGSPKTDNAAALMQAQATAANLTNWAGRAVRRAIAEHLGAENVTETPERNHLEKVQSESDDSEVEIVESTNGNKSTVISAHDYNLTVNEEHAKEAAEILQNYENDLAHAGNSNIEREIEGVTDEIEEEVMQLLQLFGVPYIRAPAEAEAQCAMLEKLGLVNGIVVRENSFFA